MALVCNGMQGVTLVCREGVADECIHRRRPERFLRTRSEPTTKLFAQHGNNDGSLARPDVAFEVENLLPGTEHELSFRDRYGQGRAQ